MALGGASQGAREAIGMARRGVGTVIERIDPGTLAELIVRATRLQEMTNASLREKGSPYRIADISISASIPPGVSFSIGPDRRHDGDDPGRGPFIRGVDRARCVSRRGRAGARWCDARRGDGGRGRRGRRGAWGGASDLGIKGLIDRSPPLRARDGSDVGRDVLGELLHQLELRLVLEEREVAPGDELDRHARLAPDVEQRLDELRRGSRR